MKIPHLLIGRGRGSKGHEVPQIDGLPHTQHVLPVRGPDHLTHILRMAYKHLYTETSPSQLIINVS